MFHRVAPPTSMYSMNRSSARSVRAKSSRSVISSSLNPRRMTLLILTGPSPASRAARMPAMMSSWRVLRAKAASRSGRSVSRLTVTRWRPASRSSSATGASRTPLVVRARSRTPGTPRSDRTSEGSSCRSSGSPPVSLTLETPSDVNKPVSRTSSSNVRIDSRGKPGVVGFRHAIPAAEIAAVRDREAKTAEGTREGIAHRVVHSAVRMPAGMVPPAAVGSTHASEPSAYRSRFQIGTRDLSSSIT